MAPYLDLLCGGGDYNHFLQPARWSAYMPALRERTDLFNRIEPLQVLSRKSIGHVAPLLIDAISLNPAVEILTLEPERS